MSYTNGTTKDSHKMATSQSKQSLTEEGKQQLRKASRQISHTISEQASEAKSKLKDTAVHQKREVVNQMSSVNDALRKTAANLDHPRLEQSLETLAGKVETAADRLAEADIADIVDASGRLARENSTAFALASFALGLGLARFLKATPGHPEKTQLQTAEAIALQKEPVITETMPHEAR